LRNSLYFLLIAVLLAGCSMLPLPDMRVGQKKIDPKTTEKPPEQVEAERRGAAYLSLRSLVFEPDARQQLLEIHSVAEALSASLGEPKKPVKIEDKDAVIAELRAGRLADQKKIEGYRAFTRKYAGQAIDGTGVDLAPWGGGLGLIAIVAACIFVPGFGTLVLFVIRRLRATVQQMAQGVEEFAVEHPDKAEELKEYFSSAMDRPAKAILKREKKFLDRENLQELLRRKVVSTTA
jgi:hypothetical protein